VSGTEGTLNSEIREQTPVTAADARLGVTPSRATTIVVLVGLVITVSVAWTARTLDHNNEHRLLAVQTRQAAAVLSSTILSLQSPLSTTLEVETATGGSTQQFDRFASTYVGPTHPFMSAILWRTNGATWQPVSQIGATTLMDPSSSQATTVVTKASTGSFVVAPVPANRPRRIGYAVGNSTTVIYAERAIPANRVVPVESGSAFSDLNFATYLGHSTDLSAMATTDLPLNELPITGDTDRLAIPFGDSSLTLVTAPRGALGGTLSRALPWVFLIGGVLLTTGAAIATYQLVRRRRHAEQDAVTIADLYGQLDGLYAEQRSIAESLQRALLPQRNPSVLNLEIGSRYLPGTDDIEIGGDWFSLTQIDPRHFAFAVGDVSGKGVAAASIMARLRFTIRAYLLEGHAPDVVLEMCSRQLNVNRDGHMVTVLVGVGDTETGIITVANAGHLNPLLVSDDNAEFIVTRVGLPLGVAPSTYRATTIPMSSGAVFVAFTDGLVERRGESIDIGMGRVSGAVVGSPETVDDLLDCLTGTLAGGGASDDVAILAFRWSGTSDRPGSRSTRHETVS